MTTSSEVRQKAQVIHVDFKAEKRRKTPASPQKNSALESADPIQSIFLPASIHPIRAWNGASFHDRMMAISGWWIRLTVFVTLVVLGYFAFG